MGRIGKITGATVETIEGAEVREVTADPSDGDLLTADVFGAPGVKAGAVPDVDYAVLVPVQGGWAAVGFADPANSDAVNAGEIKIVGRDSSGAVVSTIYLANNGVVTINGNLTVDP